MQKTDPERVITEIFKVLNKARVTEKIKSPQLPTDKQMQEDIAKLDVFAKKNIKDFYKLTGGRITGGAMGSVFPV